MSQTLQQQVMARILQAHRANFDVQEGHRFAGRSFAGYAEFHSHSEGYVLSRRAKLWEADAHQYLFFEAAGHLDDAQLAQWVRFMQTDALAKVKPAPNHMASDVCLVFVAQGLDDDAATRLRRTRFRKNHRFGLQGWSDLKLAAVDLGAARVVSNAAGRSMVPLLQQCLAKELVGQTRAQEVSR